MSQNTVELDIDATIHVLYSQQHQPLWGVGWKKWSIVELRIKNLIDGSCWGKVTQVECGVSWSHY